MLLSSNFHCLPFPVCHSTTSLIPSLLCISQHLLHLRVVRTAGDVADGSVFLDSGHALRRALWVGCCEGGEGEEAEREEKEDGTHDGWFLGGVRVVQSGDITMLLGMHRAGNVRLTGFRQSVTD